MRRILCGSAWDASTTTIKTEPAAMARFALREGAWHPARLDAVRKKPLENQRLTLLRLEFEIFRVQERNVLKSTGMIACRDLVVGSPAEMAGDPGVQRYAAALGVTHPTHLQAWLKLQAAKSKPWVKIQFGPRDSYDHRNTFAATLPYDPVHHRIVDYPYDLSLEWVSAGDAAKALDCHVSTIRRLVEKHEPFHGSELVRRTGGNHRRINLPLLRNLIPND